jgi:hypothetical protein
MVSGMISHRWKLVCATMLCFLTPMASGAQDIKTRTLDLSVVAGMKMLSEDQMKQTGGQEPVSINLLSNQSSVSGNQIGNVGATGVISASSLANNSGLTTLIANSGNQVVISQSTIVNVYLH